MWRKQYIFDREKENYKVSSSTLRIIWIFFVRQITTPQDEQPKMPLIVSLRSPDETVNICYPAMLSPRKSWVNASRDKSFHRILPQVHSASESLIFLPSSSFPCRCIPWEVPWLELILRVSCGKCRGLYPRFFYWCLERHKAIKQVK